MLATLKKTGILKQKLTPPCLNLLSISLIFLFVLFLRLVKSLLFVKKMTKIPFISFDEHTQEKKCKKNVFFLFLLMNTGRKYRWVIYYSEPSAKSSLAPKQAQLRSMRSFVRRQCCAADSSSIFCMCLSGELYCSALGGINLVLLGSSNVSVESCS